jgi:hypothetical protein
MAVPAVLQMSMWIKNNSSHNIIFLIKYHALKKKKKRKIRGAILQIQKKNMSGCTNTEMTFAEYHAVTLASWLKRSSEIDARLLNVGYSPAKVMEQNKSFLWQTIINLNRLVVTFDSQEGRIGRTYTPCSMRYVDSMSHGNQKQLPAPKGECYMGVTCQRAYLAFVTTSSFYATVAARLQALNLPMIVATNRGSHFFHLTPSLDKPPHASLLPTLMNRDATTIATPASDCSNEAKTKEDIPVRRSARLTAAKEKCNPSTHGGKSASARPPIAFVALTTETMVDSGDPENSHHLIPTRAPVNRNLVALFYFECEAAALSESSRNDLVAVTITETGFGGSGEAFMKIILAALKTPV